MKPALARRTLLFTFAAFLAAGGFAHSRDMDGDRDDHDRAHQARKGGHARPLAEILDKVRGQLGGEIVGIEFEDGDGRYLYEFKVVAPDGRLREVYVDAMTAEILGNEED